MPSSRQPVLLYDGECGLCNAIVRFMLRHDRRGVLLFAPLQGVAGQAFLRSRGLNTEDFDSLVFIEDRARADSVFFLRTAGALRALGELGGAWGNLARILGAVPACCSDLLYKCIARTRHRFFGQYRPAPPPDPSRAKRILD